MRFGSILAVALLALTGCAHEERVATPPPAGHTQDYVFEAEPSTIAPGETVTLHWNIPGAAKVTIEGARLRRNEELQKVGTFGPVGKVDVKPVADMTYVITCEGSGSVTCASISVRVRVKR